MITGNRRHTPDGRWLSNVPKRYKNIVRQAAKATDFDVYADEPRDSVYGIQQIGVYTRQPERDHGPFWAEYHRLKAEMEHTDEMPVL